MELSAGGFDSMSLLRLPAAFLLVSGFALADTWSGTVVDVMCKDKDLANHTAKCSVNCAKSGFGVVLADGKFLKFNESGNAKALALLKTSAKEKDLKAKITGTLEDTVISVQSIELQ